MCDWQELLDLELLDLIDLENPQLSDQIDKVLSDEEISDLDKLWD